MRRHTKKSYLVCVSAACLALTAWVAPLKPAYAVEPIIKQGPCPMGYSTSGNYCVPGRNADPAVPKIGPCPAGYYSAGSYCLGSKRSSPAIERKGPCPPGYSAVGSYCIKSR